MGSSTREDVRNQIMGEGVSQSKINLSAWRVTADECYVERVCGKYDCFQYFKKLEGGGGLLPTPVVCSTR